MKSEVRFCFSPQLLGLIFRISLSTHKSSFKRIRLEETAYFDPKKSSLRYTQRQVSPLIFFLLPISYRQEKKGNSFFKMGFV